MIQPFRNDSHRWFRFDGLPTIAHILGLRLRLSVCIFFAIVTMPIIGNAWMWDIPATVDGEIHKDHFGGHYFYNDIGLLYVSEKAGDLVSPHLDKLVTLNVTGIYQITIPGDIRIDRFTIADPAEDAAPNRNQLQLVASLEKNGEHPSIKLRVTNRGDKIFSLYPAIIDFFMTAKVPPGRNGRLSMSVADGPSVLMGRERIMGWPQRVWKGAYNNGQNHFNWSVRGGHEIKDKVDLQPNQTLDIMIDFEDTNEECELFFGYKLLRDSSFETANKINDLVLPVISNAIALNSNHS